MDRPVDKKTTAEGEQIFKGTPLSRGVGVAPVCIFNDTAGKDIPVFRINVNDISYEKDRLNKAFDATEEKLRELKERTREHIGEVEAAIFEVYLKMLRDSSIERKITELIEENHLNAEAAVAEIFDSYENELASSENEYMRERSSDISELKTRILGELRQVTPSFECSGQSGCVKDRERIIVAEELTPQLTMHMSTENIAGIVTEKGGSTSHAAIVARALGIPAVSGIKGIHSLLSCGTEIAIDGARGEVVLSPGPNTVARIEDQLPLRYKMPEKVSPVKGLTVMANINLAPDITNAINMKAEGIGLYRTEFEFLMTGRALSEEEQYTRYARVLGAMKNKPVYFRVLDLGSDKQFPALKFVTEDNPALGLRGARLLEESPELLRIQARALARASGENTAWVMFPMVVGAGQFIKLREAFREAVSDIKEADIKYGVMFEVPSACYEADDILREAEFASIGTNDLIQYFFAVDRNNDAVSYDHSPDREVFWKLLKNLAETADRHDRPISICGEMAGEARFLKNILRAGINTVSVSPRLIPEVRKTFKSGV